VVESSVQYVMDPNRENSKRVLALSAAVLKDHVTVVALLLGAGDKVGNELQTAASFGSLSCLQLLLKAGFWRDRRGLLTAAARVGAAACVDVLLEYGADIEELFRDEYVLLDT
jgi:ankyrin repeat protein